VKRRFIIDRDFLARLYVAQRYEENVIVKDLHKSVRPTRVIYIMRAIASATPIQTPAIIYLANS